MDFKSTATHDSEVYPGVKFTVRKLNVWQRLERDNEIGDDVARAQDITADYNTLPDSELKRKAELNREFLAVNHRRIMPVAIKAGLESIKGLAVDGEPVTDYDGLVKCGAISSEFIDEVFVACQCAAGVYGDDRKNSASPGISTGRTDGADQNSTAGSASEKNTTESADAVDTSPGK